MSNKKTCDHSGVEIPQSNEVEILTKEVERLKKIIAKEFNENDELGCEYTYVNILKDENAKLKDKNKRLVAKLREYKKK
jgi:hypothetical protein